MTYRNNPNGAEPSIGITGQFEVTSTFEGAPVMVAPVIFLPTAFCKMLEGELMKGQESLVPKKSPAKGKGINVDGVASIALALEIGIRKNVGASGVGYEFSVVQATDGSKASDPFADLRVLLPASAGRAALPAPAPVTPKKKRK